MIHKTVGGLCANDYVLYFPWVMKSFVVFYHQHKNVDQKENETMFHVLVFFF